MHRSETPPKQGQRYQPLLFVARPGRPTVSEKAETHHCLVAIRRPPRLWHRRVHHVFHRPFLKNKSGSSGRHLRRHEPIRLIRPIRRGSGRESALTFPRIQIKRAHIRCLAFSTIATRPVPPPISQDHPANTAVNFLSNSRSFASIRGSLFSLPFVCFVPLSFRIRPAPRFNNFSLQPLAFAILFSLRAIQRSSGCESALTFPRIQIKRTHIRCLAFSTIGTRLVPE